MNNLELKKLVLNESISALQNLRDGSMDKITLEERLERFVRCRVIISNVQLFDMSYVKNGTEITLGFSPWFMLSNRSQLYKDSLDQVI